MVRGIATDSKKYKHIHRDEKWLTKDLHDIKRTVEHYIDEIRPAAEKEINQTFTKSTKKTMTVDRVFAILFFGIFGSITLISGIYFIIKQTYVVGISLAIFGLLLVVCFVLFERYR